LIKQVIVVIDDKDLKELGAIKTEEGILLPRDFCLVSLLNWYNNPKTPLSDEQYETLSEFLFQLELDFGICDGAKDKYNNYSNNIREH
jgi:hypothetical protein